MSGNEGLSYGFFLGFFERIVIERLPLFWHKATFDVIAGASRVYILHNNSVQESIFRVLVTIFATFLDFYKEKKERNMFEAFYKSRESLVQFKQLFKSYLPESILVLRSDLREHLFKNDSFIKAFESIMPGSAQTPIKDILKKFKLEKDELQAARPKLIKLGVDVRARGESSETRRNTVNEGSEMTNFREDITKAKTNLYSVLRALHRVGRPLEDFDFIFSYSGNDSKGSVKMCKVQAFPFPWDGKEALAVFITDITEQYTLINLKLADENKDKVVATVSHELRTPLNGILGMVNLLQNEVKKPHLKNYLKICESSGRLLLSLVNSILDLAQIKNNKLKLNISKHSVRECLNDIVSLFEFQCQQKNLYLHTEIDETIPEFINTDKNRLTQIIINLMGNALKFTSQGGITLKVETNLDPDSFIVSVSDTGVGIKEEEKASLFKMYGKLEGTADINTQGVGLGLNISYELAKLLNEDEEGSGIRVESEYQRGSTFWFPIKADLKDLSLIERSRRESGASNMVKKPLFKKHEKSGDSDEFSKPLDYDEKDGEKYFMTTTRTQPALTLGLSDKILKYCSNINTPQISPESRPKTKRILRITEHNESENNEYSLWTSRGHLLAVNSPSISCSRLISLGNPIEVLVVDDNSINILIARKLIEAQGCIVTTAINGQEAVNTVVRRNQIGKPFQLILMDCEMTVMDGYQATRILVEKMNNQELTEIPIIALTSHTVNSVRDECLKAGMTECLAKPLVMNDFKEMVVKYVHQNMQSP